MTTFRKKPVEIEATQWTGHNTDEMAAFASSCFRVVEPGHRVDDPSVTAQVYDVLHCTWVGVKTDQWVIRGVQGEFYPIDPDVLAATYDEVPT